MSTVQVQVRKTAQFTNMPSAYAVSRLCSQLADITESTGEAQATIIGWYADTWSVFARREGTDFEPAEWIKRNFKGPAADFERMLKNADPRFDPKHQTYKNVKGTLAKCAYAMIDPTGQSMADLKKALKSKGLGETLPTLIQRLCKALAPCDELTGELAWTSEDLRDAGAALDDPTAVTNAVEVLAHVLGRDRILSLVNAMPRTADPE